MDNTVTAQSPRRPRRPSQGATTSATGSRSASPRCCASAPTPSSPSATAIAPSCWRPSRRCRAWSARRSTTCSCLRRMCDDNGWIRTLMEEAENERMHLMTFIEVAKPTLFERCVILGVQWVFYVAFFALYLVSATTAHRVVGYFEEEAVISYTHYLKELDEGRSPERAGAGDRAPLLEAAGRRDAARRRAGGAGRRGAPPRRQPRLRRRAGRPIASSTPRSRPIRSTPTTSVSRPEADDHALPLDGGVRRDHAAGCAAPRAPDEGGRVGRDPRDRGQAQAPPRR